MSLLCSFALFDDSMHQSKFQLQKQKSQKDKKEKIWSTLNHLATYSMFNQKSAVNEKGLAASYEIAKLRAKEGKPHTTGESFIFPTVSVVIVTVMNQNPRKVVSDLPSNNSSMSRRTDQMTDEVEKQLVSQLRIQQSVLQVNETYLACRTTN